MARETTAENFPISTWPWSFNPPTEGDFGQNVFFKGPQFSFISDEGTIYGDGRPPGPVTDKQGVVKDPLRWEAEVVFDEESNTAKILRKAGEWALNSLQNDDFKKQAWPRGKPPSNEVIAENYKLPFWDLGGGRGVTVRGKFTVGRKDTIGKRKERDPASLWLVKKKGGTYTQTTDFASALLPDCRVQVKICFVGLTLSGKANWYNMIRFDSFMCWEKTTECPFTQTVEAQGLKRQREAIEDDGEEVAPDTGEVSVNLVS